MSAPTALDSARTGTPDGTNGIKIPTVLMQEDSTFEAPGGIALTDRIPAAPTADRSLMTAADSATDMSTTAFAGAAGANLLNINNRGAIVVWCTFEASTDSAIVRIVYYDASDNPLFVGPPLTFAPLAQRLSAAGHYMSTPQIVESYGASQYRPYLSTKGDAVNDVSIFGQPI
jgi:hypothetical protein